MSSGPTRTPGGEPSRKNPWAAAVLNLLFPGIGYIYNGVGRDTHQIIMGLMVFAFFFFGFGVSIIIVAATTPSGASTGGHSPYAELVLLAYLLPVAFAYDGYHRASTV